MILPSSFFRLPLRAGAALWAVSVAVGAWAAYDTRAALLRAALLLLALAPVLLALTTGPTTFNLGPTKSARRPKLAQPSTVNKQSSISRPEGSHFQSSIPSAAAAVALAIAAYYLLSRVVTLPEDINANVAANALLILLPFAVAGMAHLARSRRWAAVIVMSMALLVVLAAIAVSGSRGAWLGLAAGAVAAAAVRAMDRVTLTNRRDVACYVSTERDDEVVDGGTRDGGRHGAVRGVGFAALVFLAVAGAMAAIMALPALGQAAGVVGGAGATAVTRADLWRDMLIQARDYAFTGSGLGATMMVDASYVRLLHVGFITHSHNLYLQIMLEQGPLGLLGFLLIVGGSLAGLVAAGPGPAERSGAEGLLRLRSGRTDGRNSAQDARSPLPVGRGAEVTAAAEGLRLAAVASIVALLVHGIVDAGVYVALPAPLLFAAVAVGAAGGGLKIEDGRLKIGHGATVGGLKIEDGKLKISQDDAGAVGATRDGVYVGSTHASTLPTATMRDALPSQDAARDDIVVETTGRSPASPAPLRSASSSAAPGAIFNLQSSIFNRALPPLALALILLAALLPPVRAAFLANLGAVAQSKAELSRYEWPTWGIQDELRRSGEIDLAPAVALYRGSLRLNPLDPVANRRLGQIALSLGEYAEAGALLAGNGDWGLGERGTGIGGTGTGQLGAGQLGTGETGTGQLGNGETGIGQLGSGALGSGGRRPGHGVGYTNGAAARLYGEWLAIEGHTAEAAALWRTVDVSQGQLDARAWWYDHIGEPDRAERVRAAAAAAAVEG